MTTFSSSGEGARDFRTASWQGGCGMRWRPLEIAALVVGFAVWWPLGLAVLGMKMARRRGYGVDDLFAKAKSAFAGGPPFAARSPGRWQPFASGSGNTAFDDWRNAELAKLEEERRKLDAAHKEFAEHLDNLRRARDQAEFESFLAARRNAQPPA